MILYYRPYDEDRERQIHDEAVAKRIRSDIIGLAQERGDEETVARLSGSGAASEPSIDEMELVADYLGGVILVTTVKPNNEPVHIVKGTGDVVAHIYHAQTKDGDPKSKTAQHWRLKQSWLPLKPEGAAPLSGRGPRGPAGRAGDVSAPCGGNRAGLLPVGSPVVD